MDDNELLFAISDMMDKKLDAKFQPVEKRLKNIEITLENSILPRLKNIEACYTSTYNRYIHETESIGAIKADIEI